ncbi:tetratricopeptide repeat protein [Jeongeupia sp. USM3]|uniref:tetratricopeptide repeat protein n=1 Tax=Jeongeupia sp. USM3 TaxID=1906741 RepID=UPI00089DFEE6|nr:tetratricopeptide repeat protein [Jeongeupia sp. USM3]AOY01201.1 hypothetical protein BJP62_12560 [Jeongeupia sp. USM3]
MKPVLTAIAVPALLCACAQNPAQIAQAQQDALAARASIAEPPAKAADAQGAYQALIASMLDQGTYYAALSHLDAFEARYGSSPQSQLMRARAERATGKLEPARQRYLALLAGPQRAAAEHGLALVYASERDSGSASRYLRDATRDAPTNPAVWNDLGYLLLLRGEWTEAGQALARAVELAPNEPRFRANLALYRQLSSGAADPAIPDEVARRINADARQWLQPAELQLAQTLAGTPDR